MVKYRIRDWGDIKDNFTHKLLLGNGASIAVWEGSNYQSLYGVADEANRIDNRLRRLFKDFGTTDFEYILKLLSQTKRVNRLLRISDSYTPSLYRELKKTLIDTICDIHPKHEQVKSLLLPMAEFMMRFDAVLSLNYDLLVYWAMLEGNDKYGNWFKDGFVDEGRFDNDYRPLYEAYKADDATLVFYPHGNLILSTESLGDEVKLSKSGENYLLETVLEKWETGDHIPLFVSEGGMEEKLQAIRRSNYLKTVYDYEVDSGGESLVVYGWSFREEDEHILKGIVHGGVDRIAVSVHTSSGDKQSFCEAVEHKVNKMHHTLNKERKCKLYYFNSASDGAWINKLEEIVF
ncbi:DUF4917 family protein [Chloroflexota bacterium]